MATTNDTIIGKFRLSGTTDFDQRIGNPTQQAMSVTVANLFDPINRNIYNQFLDFCVNQIGLTYARQQKFENPLKEFIKDKLVYGGSVAEAQLNWIKGHAYNVNAEEQFKTYYPDGLQAFHSLNYEMQYPISISREQMRQAVTSEYGLNTLIASIMQQPLNADEYDMFQSMLRLIASADTHYGLYREHIDNAPTDEESCKKFLQKVQQLSYDLTVPTTTYSCTDLPVLVEKDEMVLFIRSDVMASTNVQALAVLFNMEQADIPYRTKVVPVSEWMLKDDDYAILTTSDFFQVYNVDYCISSQWDAPSLKTNFWLTDRNVMSFSPFVPCIVFSSASATGVKTVTMTPTTFNLISQAGNTIDVVNNNYKVQLVGSLNGTLSSEEEKLEIAPDSWTSEIIYLENGENKSEKLNSRTYVSYDGVLHIQKTGINYSNNPQIKIKATSTYVNPATNKLSDTLIAELTLSLTKTSTPTPVPPSDDIHWTETWEDMTEEDIKKAIKLANDRHLDLLERDFGTELIYSTIEHLDKQDIINDITTKQPSVTPIIFRDKYVN